ncbi:MAG: cadherin repeat domain-containing protein [bacterium]|nr:cadherin repeat domain-containing protein [bacterium]
MNPIRPSGPSARPNGPARFKRFARSAVKLTGIIAVALLLLAPVQCSKKKDDSGKTVVSQKEVRSPEPMLDRVRIDPDEPSANHIIRAIPLLNDIKMRKVSYTCRWFVNSKEITGETGRTLDLQYYKKGDRVYCEVIATRGIHQSEPIESKVTTIGNSNPVINLDPIEPFPVPGHFYYKINAVDPDGDTLTYRLMEPLGKGITVNPESGEITWEIQALSKEDTGPEPGRPEDENTRPSDSGDRPKEEDSPKDALTSVVKIEFEVRDSDGGVAVATITLNLTRGSEVVR